MSLKRFRIEQLCPSIDSMISLVFVHYAINVIVNLNFHENHMQYVHNKTDYPCGSYTTQFVSTKTGKNH